MSSNMEACGGVVLETGGGGLDMEAGAGAAGGVPPPDQQDTDIASEPSGNDSTPEPPKVTAEPHGVAGHVIEKLTQSEQHVTENLCSKEAKKPSPSDSCTTASTIPSLATPQSVTEVQSSEDMLSSPMSKDNDLSSDSCAKVTNKSSQEADITGGSASALEGSSKSHQSGEGGKTAPESGAHLLGETPHGKSSISRDDITDKSSEDGKQRQGDASPGEKEPAPGETTGGASDGAAKPAGMPTSSSEIDEEKQSIYQVKWIKHKTTTMPIITQNENGPCPLLAIMNLLLLQSKIKLASGAEVVTSNELMAHLADWIFEHVPKNISEDTRLNYEQNMHDAIAVFPRLQTGLDVNVRFTGVSQFEYTPECIVFDLLDIPLYHGWLVDPQMSDLVSAIGNGTYNQLVEKIIVQKNSNKEDLITEALLAEEFLNVTASQLTYHGLSELSATTKEEEMCVLFRNNHFSTLYKHKNELFVLVTDQGFLRESNVVWETLSNIEGDGHFVDSEFRTYRLPEASTAPLPTPSFPVNSKEQIDHDYLVALSLEHEQSEIQPGAMWSDSATLSDHELALRLQEEENMSTESASRQQPAPRQQKPDTPATAGSNLNATGSGSSSSSGVPGKEKKDSSCSVM